MPWRMATHARDGDICFSFLTINQQIMPNTDKRAADDKKAWERMQRLQADPDKRAAKCTKLEKRSEGCASGNFQPTQGGLRGGVRHGGMAFPLADNLAPAPGTVSPHNTVTISKCRAQ